jgi:hypothetical protein
VLSFARAGNYVITYTDGTLYINPKGNGAKKLRPYLDCVTEVINPPSQSRRYIARFYVINDNATTMSVDIGLNNKLISNGSYDGSEQPSVFPPGTSYFTVPFDGTALTYSLTTYESSAKKTATASDASSTSNRCGGLTRTAMPVQEAEIVARPFNAYPNPVTDKVRIDGIDPLQMKSLILSDAQGRIISNGTFKVTGVNSVTLDMKALKPGVYFVRLDSGDQFKVIRLVKL